LRKPYTGIVPIVSGEIAKDLAFYLTESEQTPSAVALGVRVDSDGAVTAAGGFLAQALPDADDEELALLEANVQRMAPVSEIVSEGGAVAVLASLTRGVGTGSVERNAPAFHCGCNDERVVRAVSLLGDDEIRDLCRRGEVVEVRCEFCAEQYRVDPERARALLDSAPSATATDA
jgi:molecular chaperone Hsp33